MPGVRPSHAIKSAYGCGGKISKGVGGPFLSYGVLNNALTNPDLVQNWFFTTTLVSQTGPGLASKGLSKKYQKNIQCE